MTLNGQLTRMYIMLYSCVFPGSYTNVLLMKMTIVVAAVAISLRTNHQPYWLHLPFPTSY